MERWLPVLGVAVGLSLMAIAMVAEGQPIPEQAAPSTMPMGGSGSDGDGPPHPHRGWGRDIHGGFPAMAPEQVCKERFAREAGFLAYVGAKLEVTAAQQPLWEKYHQAMLDSAGKLRQVCLDNANTAPAGVTALERRDRMEKFLTARLDALHATRPPLEALYQSLTPQQRALLDHPHAGPG